MLKNPELHKQVSTIMKINFEQFYNLWNFKYKWKNLWKEVMQYIMLCN